MTLTSRWNANKGAQKEVRGDDRDESGWLPIKIPEKDFFLILWKGDGQYTDVLERFELWMEDVFFFYLFFFSDFHN